MTLLLALGIGNWAALRGSFDAQTAAQNARLTFQKASPTTNIAEGITSEESAAADVVMQKLARPLDATHAQILYIGNSQSLAIMDARAGDLLTPQWMQV